MKFNNNINLISLCLGLLVTLAACSEGFLEENPRSEISADNYFVNDAQAIAIANAAYSGFAALPGQYRYGYRRDLGYFVDAHTDILRTITARGPMDALTVSEGDSWNNGIWTTLYMAISQANLAISRIPGMPIDTDLSSRLVGECKFLRALAYYHIVQVWGEAPLKLTEEDAQTVDQAKASEAEIIATIKSDLLEAIPVLPLSYSGADLGRVTSGAAKALLGKVYLLNQEFVEAENIFKDIIDNHDYALVTPYSMVFSIYNENNQEIVFDIQFNVNVNGQNFSDFYGSRAITTEGPRQSSLGGGFGVLRHHKEYADLFDVNDARRKITVIDTIPATGDPIIQDEWGWGKFVDSVDFAAVVNEGNNWPVIRYSDVILSYGEALWRNGKLPEAVEQINLVRERARNSNGASVPTDYPSTLSDAEVKAALRLERKLELGGEGHGWYDSKRFGTLVEDNARVGVTVTDPNYKWPIPTTELDANGAISNTGD